MLRNCCFSLAKIVFFYLPHKRLFRKNRKKGYCNKIGWKIKMKSWKIGWQISRPEEYLPAFICLIIRELRRNWKIWRFFLAI